MGTKKVFLVGNPNTGKTTLFNALTRSHEHVGNWHGVTVEEKSKIYTFAGQNIELVDLPGLYSMTSFSYEEEVSVKAILENKDALIINICDSNNLQRNLYLTLGLMEVGANVILAVNQMDKVYSSFNILKLEKALGLQIVGINAQKKEGLDKLNQAILSYSGHKNFNLPYLQNISHRSEDIENDAKIRYDYIDKLKQQCDYKLFEVYGKSRLDKILMNRFLAFPIFLCFLALVFYLTFFSIGAWLSDGLNFLLQKCIGDPLISLCQSVFGQQSWFVGLVENAIVGGVGSILGFLPQVVLLFLFLSLLEDSGYLARVAFAIDDVLSKVGLSGKSVYTLLMGFGCSTTAVLTARNMEDKNSKIKTALLTPYMSCSAKFPIYSVLGGAFFGAKNIFVIMGLYLLGVVVAITLSFIFEKTILKSKQQTFILEFPPYKSVGIKRLFSVLWENVKLFLVRVGSLIISMNVIVWILGSFSFTLSYVPVSGGISILESLGRLLAPIFAPLGFGSWGMVAALIAGLVAKEVILSSIALFNKVDEGGIANSVMDPQSAIFFASPPSVISYLVFSLLYFPCLASVAVLGKEIGKKWMIIGVIIEFLVAYGVTFVIYNIAKAFIAFGPLKVISSIIFSVIILISIILIFKFIKRPPCARCNKREGCKFHKD